MTFEEICSVFGAEGYGDRRKCKCPAHEDKQASLSISKGSNGKTLIHCHAGCSIESVLSAKGLKFSDLGDGDSPKSSEDRWRGYVESSMSRKKGKPLKIEAVYHYTDIHTGAYACTKVRLTGKEMTMGIINNGRFSGNLGGKKLEDWPAVFTKSVIDLRNAAARGERIYYAEGEKDVLTLQKHGYLAVTCGGCEQWRPVYSELFKGADVVICADNDDKGIAMAHRIERDLKGIASAVTMIIPVPDVEKADISDFFERGGTDQQLQQLITDSKQDNMLTSKRIDGLFNVSDIIGDNLKPKRDELIPGILREGHVMLISGASKVGKSFSVIELACAVASGSEWMGRKCKQGRVLYVNFELDEVSVAHRFQRVVTAMHVDIDRNVQIYQLRGKHSTAESVCRSVEAICKDWIPALVIIDPVYRLIEGDENSAVDVAKLFSYIDGLAQGCGTAVLMVHHHSKGGQAGKAAMDRSSGSGVFARSPDAVLDILELEINADAAKRLTEAYGADTVFKKCTGFRIEMTLREFQTPDPVTGWFEYPVHRIDSRGILKDARTAMEARSVDAKRNANRKNGISWGSAIADAIRDIKSRNQQLTIGNVADVIGCSTLTLKDHLVENGYTQKQGIISIR